LFCALLNRFGDTPSACADFRLLSRAAADGLRQMREHHRFLRGMVSWMGFRTVSPYGRRAHRRHIRYHARWCVAIDAAFSFSLAPLWIGLSVIDLLLLAGAEAVYVLSFWCAAEPAAPAGRR
jgi:dolichol-phosphate mannosyltransferase